MLRIHRRNSVRAVLLASFALAAFFPTAAASRLNGGGAGNSMRGKSSLVQDPRWVTAKLAGKIHLHGSSAFQPNTVGSSYQLDTSIMGNTDEPPAYGPDAVGNSYTDTDFFKTCAEGATDVALYYWGRPSSSYGQRTYSVPNSSRANLTFNDTRNRSYLLYLMTQSWPPSFGSGGEFAFSSHTTFQPDIRDVLNWEASGHNTSTWSTFYYYLYWMYGTTNGTTIKISAGQMDTYIQDDLWYDHRPVIMNVNATYLPNWSGATGTINHSIAIVGYNVNYLGTTYTYIDTCGSDTGCGRQPAGVYTVSHATLYNAMKDDSCGSNCQTGNMIW